MLPTLIEIRFDTPFAQAVAYVLAVLLLGYGIWAGWRNAPGSLDKKGKELPPTREQRATRAAIYGVLFAIVLLFGLYYALPAMAFLGAKGEGLPIHTYGLMIIAGFAAAIMVSTRLAEREWGGAEGVRRRNDAADLAVWVVLGGLIGSKILFIIVTPKDFIEALASLNPARILASLGGGFVFYGGFIGAAGAVWWFCRQRKIPFLRLADVIAPTVALGQAFGRLDGTGEASSTQDFKSAGRGARSAQVRWAGPGLQAVCAPDAEASSGVPEGRRTRSVTPRANITSEMNWLVEMFHQASRGT